MTRRRASLDSISISCRETVSFAEAGIPVDSIIDNQSQVVRGGKTARRGYMVREMVVLSFAVPTLGIGNIFGKRTGRDANPLYGLKALRLMLWQA